MKTIINQKQAVDLLKKSMNLDGYEVVLDATIIDVTEAILLKKAGVDIPKELTTYNDAQIDTSDVPEINGTEIWE